MIVEPDQYDALYGNSSRARRGTTSNSAWPFGEVPYSLEQLKIDLGNHVPNRSSEFDGRVRKIRTAIQEFTSHTQLKFYEVDSAIDKLTHSKGVLEFRSGWCDANTFIGSPGTWCYSHVGDVGVGSKGAWLRVTTLNLDLVDNFGQCWKQGTIIHELGHAVGLWHEQDRPDRDNYLYPANKERGTLSSKQHRDIDSLGTKYDFASIMHYPLGQIGTGAAVTSKGRKRLAEQHMSEQEIGARAFGRGTLSELDILGLNLLCEFHTLKSVYACECMPHEVKPCAVLRVHPCCFVWALIVGCRCRCWCWSS